MERVETWRHYGCAGFVVDESWCVTAYTCGGCHDCDEDCPAAILDGETANGWEDAAVIVEAMTGFYPLE